MQHGRTSWSKPALPLNRRRALGLGIGLAIALDASIVRVLLVPATMRLLGDWNWWVPRIMLRLLPERGWEH